MLNHQLGSRINTFLKMSLVFSKCSLFLINFRNFHAKILHLLLQILYVSRNFRFLSIISTFSAKFSHSFFAKFVHFFSRNVRISISRKFCVRENEAKWSQKKFRKTIFSCARRKTTLITLKFSEEKITLIILTSSDKKTTLIKTLTSSEGRQP